MTAQDLVTVLRTQDLLELDLVRGRLEDAGIAIEVQGENGLRLLPVRAVGLFGSARVGATIRVRPADEAVVRALLAESTAEEDEP